MVPLTVHSRFVPVPLDPDIPVRLSTFAELRTDGNAYCIESPLALHRVLLHRGEAMLLIGALASPVTPAALARPVAARPGDGGPLEYLAAAGMVVQGAQGGGEPAGLRGGHRPRPDRLVAGGHDVPHPEYPRRHDHNFGITYPTGETAPAEPVVKPQASHYIQLHRPRWDELCAADPPLTAVIEGRRSMRRHGARPLTVTDLGDLLYRTARVRSLIGIGQPGSGQARPTGAQRVRAQRPSVPERRRLLRARVLRHGGRLRRPGPRRLPLRPARAPARAGQRRTPGRRRAPRLRPGRGRAWPGRPRRSSR